MRRLLLAFGLVAGLGTLAHADILPDPPDRSAPRPRPAPAPPRGQGCAPARGATGAAGAALLLGAAGLLALRRRLPARGG